MRRYLLHKPLLATKIAPLICDIFIIALSLFTAYALRYNFIWTRIHAERSEIILHGAVIAAIYITAMTMFGCYRLIWRFITVDDIPRFVYAIALPTIALSPVVAMLPRGVVLRVPLSVIFLNAIFTLGGILLFRSFVRLTLNNSSDHASSPHGHKRRVIIVGAGSTGNQVAREMTTHQNKNIRLIGFVDDDTRKKRALIKGVRVLGTTSQLPEIIKHYRANEVIIAITRAPQQLLTNVASWCESFGTICRIVPEYYDIITGKITVNRLKEVEICDLLGRAEGVLDDPAVISFFTRKRVLITGGGGTIGSELARQVARMAPTELILVERSENALYEIDRNLRSNHTTAKATPILADIADAHTIDAILTIHKPQIILHAAAHKHVPLMERNPIEAIKNNLLATYDLGLLAIKHKVSNFLLISTDKAVNPVSVMGATKRLAEHVSQHLNSLGDSKFCAVRFGNVLGSSGSVVPLFTEQIKNGGPVTVTHPEMTRYFMTTREAVRLVLHSAAMAAGGEVFVLDMGKPVKITELAEMMIRLSGLRPHEDIAITYSGIRPGEKLFEELDISDDSVLKTANARVFIGKTPPRPTIEVETMCRNLRELTDNHTTHATTAQTALFQWVEKLNSNNIEP